MRSTVVTLALLLVPAASAHAAETSRSPLAGYQVKKKTLTSQALGEERPYLVALPDSYAQASDQRYPVVYVLDGPGQGGHTARTAAALAADGIIPEVMLVAVPNLSDETRARDLTPPGLHQDHEKPDSPLGRGDVFLAFLRDELIPKVERDYRTAPFRMLAGHSRSGVFVLYSLIAEPALFDARFAHSAPVWREDEALVKRLDTFLATSPELTGDLFLSVGGAETEKMRTGLDHAAALLKAKAPQGLRWWLEVTPDADHSNNAQRSMPVGLRHMRERLSPPSGMRAP
jgi:predicted alpha/beta superfamily hydrolase